MPFAGANNNQFKSLPTVLPDNMKVAGGSFEDPSVTASAINGLNMTTTAKQKSDGSCTTMTTSIAKTGASSSKITVAKKKQRKRWKKPADKPKRPLSAYNMFFQDERKRVISEMEASGELPKGSAAATEGGNDATTSGKRRPHRKTSGVGFKKLAETISGRWKVLPNASRSPYEAQAAKNKEDYKVALAAWKEKKEKSDKEARAAVIAQQDKEIQLHVQAHLHADAFKNNLAFEQQGISAASATTAAGVGAAPFAAAIPIPGMTPQQQQQQQYLEALPGFSLPHHVSNDSSSMTPAIGIHNTSLLDHLRLSNAMANMTGAGTASSVVTGTAAHAGIGAISKEGSASCSNDAHLGAPAMLMPTRPIQALQQQQQWERSTSDASSNIRPPSSLQQHHQHYHHQQQHQQQQLQVPMNLDVAVRRLSNSFQGVPPAQIQQIAAVNMMPINASTGGNAAPSGHGGPQINWNSIQQVVNQSDASGMAAAAVSAASGVTDDDENPIEAISRAQAFLSNLKASLEAGQSHQQSG